MKAWLPPSGVERSYSKDLRKYAADVAKETERQFKERQLLRADDWSDDVTALIAYLLQFGYELAKPLIFRLSQVYGAVNQFNDRQFRFVVKSGTGMMLPSAISVPMAPGEVITDPNALRARFGMGIDLYRTEPWLAARQANWVAQNTALIKTIPERYLSDVQNIVRNGVLQGLSPKTLADQIKAAAGVADRRAKVIARDQIGKANAELTQYRQKDLGVTRYKWVTAHDERVRGNPYGRYPGARPSHYARDDKEFSWDQAPEGGHPGMAILCRCHASPVFDD